MAAAGSCSCRAADGSRKLLFDIVVDLYRRLQKPLLERLTSDELWLSHQSRIYCVPCRDDTIRGYSNISLLVIDEAARVPDRIFQTVTPMLAVSNGRMICLSTPYGKRGFFYEMVPHEFNFRTHDAGQRSALTALYREVGFARSLLAYELPDGRLKLIDGHLRRDIDPDMEVEVEVLDVSDDEARALLLWKPASTRCVSVWQGVRRPRCD
jgi:hypothetical protein